KGHAHDHASTKGAIPPTLSWIKGTHERERPLVLIAELDKSLDVSRSPPDALEHRTVQDEMDPALCLSATGTRPNFVREEPCPIRPYRRMVENGTDRSRSERRVVAKVSEPSTPIGVPWHEILAQLVLKTEEATARISVRVEQTIPFLKTRFSLLSAEKRKRGL